MGYPLPSFGKASIQTNKQNKSELEEREPAVLLGKFNHNRLIGLTPLFYIYKKM